MIDKIPEWATTPVVWVLAVLALWTQIYAGQSIAMTRGWLYGVYAGVSLSLMVYLCFVDYERE